jgi:hypothetical protein
MKPEAKSPCVNLGVVGERLIAAGLAPRFAPVRVLSKHDRARGKPRGYRDAGSNSTIHDANLCEICPHVSPRGLLLVLFVLTILFTPTTAADKQTIRLDCTPRTFHVVPGEPMRLELTVRADSAASIHLHVPGDPMLKLRAVEKLPVRRTPEGVIVHQRVVVWQALEPGLVKMDKLSVETKGQKLLFPGVTITVRDPGP